MEVVRLARLQLAVEPIVGMHPGRGWCRRPAVAASDCDPRRDAAALLVANIERHARLRRFVTPRLCNDLRCRAANEVADGEARIAAFVADVGDAFAIRRPTRA